MKPSDDPKADELRNKNLSQPKDDQIYPSNDATGEKIEMAIKK
jgi:hypothetical protein